MKLVSYVLALVSLGTVLFGPAAPANNDAAAREIELRVGQVMDSMSTEQKIAQMIMPAIRTWEDGDVTDLSAVPELAGALRRHQYGGVILFGSNIADTEQTVRLVSALQANNAQGAAAQGTDAIPYLVAADQEGGSVARLTMGTRGTGSMAIGATGDRAEENALATGRVFGEELSALGINVNLGPCVDVIAGLTDAGMSTRVFSDDPAAVSHLALAFARGVGESGVITAYKHFPGAGDGSDYPTAVRLTSGELAQGGLSVCRAVIDGGAEMVMTAAVTFPLIDEKHFMADGTTEGYYPATLSPLFVTKLLRETMGFDGVVITDALEMEQFVTEPDNGQALFRGANGTVAHDLQAAEKAINAGCDLLLIPTDLCRREAIRYYDEYIAGIAALADGGSIDARRIDASVRRILTLKAKHGLLDLDTSGADVGERVAAAVRTVGSVEHHAVETAVARQAVTLLKDDGVLPLSGGRIVIVGRTGLDSTPIEYALEQLMREGRIDAGARIENRISGEVRGGKDAAVRIVIDRYYDTPSGGRLVYSDALSAAIESADAVVCLSAVGAGIDKLQDSSPAMRGARRVLSEAHAAGAKFVLLSDNLPVDAARFQDADAIVCAYLSAGFGVDPTARTNGSENVGAFNANVPAALEAIFGAADLSGRLPIRIPVLEKGADGSWSYGAGTLYERGFSAVSGGK